MLYQYRARDENNQSREGTVEASSVDAAIAAVKQRGYQVVSIDVANKSKGLASFLNFEISLFNTVSSKDLVILSRQIATLFEAQVSPLRIFQLLSAEVDNPEIARVLNQVVEDLQGGSSISRALEQHPHVFSVFYVNLVQSGEETGSLEKTFTYLADYLDRTYEMASKAKNALIYPAFVILIFIAVMGLMLTTVIPNITEILIDSGQALPIYTQIVIGISDFLVDYIGLLLILLALAAIGAWQFIQTPPGRRFLDELKISIPYIGDLNQKLYLTRICDNMGTMISSGVPMVQAIEVTSEVVDNVLYKEMLEEVLEEVRGGRSFADAIAPYPEIPGVLSQMAKVGEESGSLPEILSTLSKFYRREVYNAVDTLISLIEPAMILLLGVGVGVLLASVLMPIYNLTTSI
jgi:type II secretory pathway component PulF